MMMATLLGWFAGQPQNRRAYPRRREGYKIWYAEGGKWLPAAGLDISASGLGVVSPAELQREEVDFRAVLHDKAIVVRAKSVWCQPGLLQGKHVWRYGLRITGVAADDWDAIVRYCNGGSVNEENVAQQQLELVRMQADDVARLIPQKLQQRLLAMLVERRRLAPLDDRPALVQYAYGGIVRRGDQHLHRLQIHSRVGNAATGEHESHSTTFLFDDNATTIRIEGE